MSSINNVIVRAVALWIHVGIGPLLGCGPMETGQTAQQRSRNRAAIGTQSRPAGFRR
jgi:hypothetical protein